MTLDSSVLLVGLSTALALMSFGGGLYEFSVVDPFWPRRPDLIPAPGRGGILPPPLLDSGTYGL